MCVCVCDILYDTNDKSDHVENNDSDGGVDDGELLFVYRLR